MRRLLLSGIFYIRAVAINVKRLKGSLSVFISGSKGEYRGPARGTASA